LVKKKSGAKRWLKLILAIVLLLFVVGGAVYVFNYSGLFRVKNINVTVTNGINGLTLSASDVFGGQPYTNILAPLPSIDMSKFPYISSFTITKNYFERTVYVQAVARQHEFIWCMTATSDCYWVDGTGLMFENAPQVSGGNLNVISDSSGRDIGMGDYALPSDLFANFAADINLLNGLEVPISSIQISDINHEEMVVVTDSGPEIYFGFTFDPVASGDEAVIRQAMQSSDWSKYCYIDLRTMYKAYTSFSCA